MRKVRWGLYGEGLRLLRVPGLVFVTLMLLISTVCVGWSAAGGSGDYEGVGCLLGWVLLAVFSAILTVRIFQFVHTRSASDFYQALPYRRITLYTAFVGAVLTWLAAGLLVFFGIFIGSLWIQGVHAAISWFDLSIWLRLGAGILLYTVGLCLFSMSLTGTLASQGLVALVLCAGPSVLRRVLLDVVNELLPVLPLGKVTTALSGLQHPYETLYGLWQVGARHYDSYIYWGDYVPHSARIASDATNISVDHFERTILYGLIIGVLFTVIACLLFCRRPIETAGRATVYPALQSVFRVLAALIISCWPTCRLIRLLTVEQSDAEQITQWGWVVAGYLFALVVYFLYELLTTRHARHLVKTLPALAIVLVFNGALVGGLTNLCRQVLMQSFDAQEVDSVTIVSLSAPTSSYFESRYPFLDKLEGFAFRETTAMKSILEYYDDTCAAVLKGETVQPADVIEIHTEGTVYRRQADLTGIGTRLFTDKDFERTCRAWPDWDDPGVRIEWLGSDAGGDQAEWQQLYETMKEEAQEIQMTDYSSYIENSWIVTEADWPTAAGRAMSRQYGDRFGVAAYPAQFVVTYPDGRVQRLSLNTLFPRACEQWMRGANRRSSLLQQMDEGISAAALAQKICLIRGYTKELSSSGNSWQIEASDSVYWESMSRAMLEGAYAHRDTVTADKAVTGMAILTTEGVWEHVYLNALYYAVDFKVLS